jgi:hypothetical protein
LRADGKVVASRRIDGLVFQQSLDDGDVTALSSQPDGTVAVG